MNNKMKYVLVGILFIAVIVTAYAAGIYSRADISSYPPTSWKAKDASATSSNRSPDERLSGQTSDPVAIPATADTKHQRINVEDYETLDDRHDDESNFRPDPYVLKQKFPDNQAVPPATREEFVEKQEERERRNREYGKISANKASREEIEQYYSDQTRLAQDSIEILLFILTEYPDQMSETDLLKNEFLIERFQKRLDLIPERKAEALERLKKK